MPILPQKHATLFGPHPKRFSAAGAIVFDYQQKNCGRLKLGRRNYVIGFHSRLNSSCDSLEKLSLLGTLAIMN